MKNFINWLKKKIFGKREEKKKQTELFHQRYNELLNSRIVTERLEEKKKAQKETYERILRSKESKRTGKEERNRRNEIDSDNSSLNVMPIIFYDTDENPTSSSHDDFKGGGGEFGGGGSSGSWESDSSSSDSSDSGCSSCGSGCGGGCGGGD